MKIALQEIKDKITPILRKHGVDRAGIFGSYTRGEMKPNSDLDILVRFKGKKSLLDLVELKADLEECLDMKVDLLTYNSLHPLLKKKILREEKAIL